MTATRILSETMTPWRPSALFYASFTPVHGHMEPDGRENERFREHFSKEPGIIKHGPWYALRRWFDLVLPIVSISDLIPLQIDGDHVREAAIETFRRLPNMITRNLEADPVRRKMAAMNGLTVEKHVCAYFREMWPNSFVPASNAGIFDRPAPDDFSIKIGKYRYKVDVASTDKKYPPKWRIHPAKMKGAQVRIFAYYNKYFVWMLGFNYPRLSNDKEIYPIERMIVRLNIQKLDIDDLFYK